MTKTNGKDVPRFDFSQWSFGDAARIAALEVRQMRLGVLQERLQRGAADFETITQYEQALDAVEDTFQEVREMFARVVRYLPRDFFVDAAPAELAYDDPATYDLLLAHKVGPLRRLILDAQAEPGKA